MKKLIALLFAISLTATASAAPVPVSVTGTPAHDATVTINGTQFGSKISPVDGSSLPWNYWDFEDGSQNSVDALSAGSGSTTLIDQNMSVVAEARNNSTRVLKSDPINWASFANLGVVSVVLNFPDQDPGARQYFSAHRWAARSNYSHTGPNGIAYENWKFYRGFPLSGTTYPNTIISQRITSGVSCTGGGGAIWTVEGTAATTISVSSVRFPSSNWMEEEYIVKFNSADRATDGIFRMRQDGDLNLDRTTYNDDGNSSSTDDLQRQFIQDDPANQNDCGGSTVSHDVKYDDIVADYGTYAHARVMLGDAATITNVSTLEYQPATSWSPTGITVKLKYGSLSPSTTKYLYVFDSNDSFNTTGLLLAAGAGNAAPTAASISPSTASYLGGTASVLTGANFMPGVTCNYGPNAAASSSYVNSTTINLVAPAGFSGSVVDVVCQNSDGQEATLSGAVTYTVAPNTPVYFDDDPLNDPGYATPFSTP